MIGQIDRAKERRMKLISVFCQQKTYVVFVLLFSILPSLAASEEPTTSAIDRSLIDYSPGYFNILQDQWDDSDLSSEHRGYIEETSHYGLLREVTAPRDLSLNECIALAIKNNTRLEVSRLDPLLARTEVRSAQAVFDPTFSTTATLDRSVSQSGSNLAFDGFVKSVEDPTPIPLSEIPAGAELDRGAIGFFLGPPTNEEHGFSSITSLSKYLRSGGNVSLEWRNNRRKSNSPFQRLQPQFTTNLDLSLNQPLLRGLGLRYTTLHLRISKTAEQAALKSYESQVASIINDVEAAYWLLVGTTESIKVQEQGLLLAKELERQNIGKYEVGTVARTAVLEAQADVARRRADLIRANKNRSNVRDTLRAIINERDDSTKSLMIVNASDPPTVEPYPIDLEQSLATALDRRAEIAAARLQLEGSGMRVELAQNKLLPRLNAVAQVGTSGLSGRHNPQISPVEVIDEKGNQIVLDGNRNPVLLFNEDGRRVMDHQPYFARLIAPHAGSYGSSLESLFDGRFYNYSAGLTFEIPLGNQGAKAEHSKSRINLERSRLALRQVHEAVTLEVKKAINDLEGDLKSIDARRIARDLAEENVRNQQARYEVGLATTKDLLDFQDRLTQARAEEVSALTEYNMHLAELRRAEGTLLEARNVVISDLPADRTPLWARF